MTQIAKTDRNGVPHKVDGTFVGSGNPGGRPRGARAEQKAAVESFGTTPEDKLKAAVERGEPWAIQRALDMRYGKPTDHFEIEATAKPEIDLTLGAFGMDTPQLTEGDNGPSED